MKPSGPLAPGSLTLTTARLLVLALATNSIDSSGESASELGVLPEGALGSIAVPIVSIGLAGLGVDHRDRVAVGVGHVEDLPAPCQQHLVGMLLRSARSPTTLKEAVSTTATAALLQRLT